MLTKEILEWPRTKYFYHELEDLSVNYCLGYSHQLHSIGTPRRSHSHTYPHMPPQRVQWQKLPI